MTALELITNKPGLVSPERHTSDSLLFVWLQERLETSLNFETRKKNEQDDTTSFLWGQSLTEVED